ncbi:MAG: hypothetical protein JNK15_04465 [Planctomycetes bacterium]|nr:hypothetical protein [Planctomycetota bacterium]
MTKAATAAVSSEDLAATSPRELLDRLLADGAAPTPNLGRGELVAAAMAHRLARGEALQGAGVLEVLPEGFGFLRSAAFDFEASPHDPFVSPSQVRSLNLKSGHRLRGPLRAPRGNERFFALTHVDRVHEAAPDDLHGTLAFAARTAVVGRRPLGVAPQSPALRALAELAPWCRGQRILAVCPPGFARLPFLCDLALALHAADATLRVHLAAIDQRPEDLAGARARLSGAAGVSVAGTTFDQGQARHVGFAELALAQAQRDVEQGHDVVLLFDSLTAQARAAQRSEAASGRWLCPGLDVQAVVAGKRLFAAARECAEGGSLTVLATAIADPESAPDRTVLAEFRHCGNSEIVVDPDLLGATAIPFDPAATRTRPEDDSRTAANRTKAAAYRQALAAAAPAARADVPPPTA